VRFWIGLGLSIEGVGGWSGGVDEGEGGGWVRWGTRGSRGGEGWVYEASPSLRGNWDDEVAAAMCMHA
jgi:hypothetical protein